MTPFTCSGLVARWIALAGASAISDAPVHHSCGCHGRLGTCIECVFKFNRPMLYALGAGGLLGVCGVSGHNLTGTNNVPILQVRYTRDTDGHLSQYTMLLLKRETALIRNGQFLFMLRLRRISPRDCCLLFNWSY
ncbi:uncharacterized protein B0H18DRAFT_636711 [Fomitopsis serialis]|uniref:uncharacterized protein n=1 Tax=Fomitopsis serialis TaxID=139415 RepID=UPI002008C406|nr:uncharacterized protein B0H18DRAFT_636711 [Neoantrodia serialis]KAH9919417.1 hypothetical protein B0H18DRAFT_636711 [Neoantrodia serialis]